VAKHEVRASWSYFIKYGRVMSSQAQIRRGTAQVPTMKPINRESGQGMRELGQGSLFSIDGLSSTCRAQSMFSVNSNSTQSTNNYSRNTSQSTLSDNSRKASQEEICIPFNKAQNQAPEQEVLQNYILTHLSSLQEEDNEVYTPSPTQDPEPTTTPVSTNYSVRSKAKKKATPFLLIANKGAKNALRPFESGKAPKAPGKLPRDKLAPFISTPASHSDNNHGNNGNHGSHGSTSHGNHGKNGNNGNHGINQVDTSSNTSSEDFRNVCEAALEKKQSAGSRVKTTQVMKQLRMRKTSGSSTRVWREEEDTEVKMLDLTGSNVGRSVSLNFNMSANTNHNELSQMTIKEEPEKIFQIIPGSMKRKKVQRKRQGGLRRSNTDY